MSQHSRSVAGSWKNRHHARGKARAVLRFGEAHHDQGTRKLQFHHE
jgi:hypothetical protein